MPKFEVRLIDHTSHTVDARYYKIDDGWVTFKSDDHNFIADFQASSVRYIMKVVDEPDASDYVTELGNTVRVPRKG